MVVFTINVHFIIFLNNYLVDYAELTTEPVKLRTRPGMLSRRLSIITHAAQHIHIKA